MADKVLSKVIMILFLLMVVVGFTVPLFNLGGDSRSPPPAEPRLCQADADCYLTCNEEPAVVLCSQNLCQRNSCTEPGLFPYVKDPTSIRLSINLNGTVLDLASRSNPKDLLVKFAGNEAQLYSSQLSLTPILEKAGLALRGNCIAMDGTQYCTAKEKELKILVNGEESFADYVPQQDDEVTIGLS